MLVMASDGMYDNLYDQDVINCVESKNVNEHASFDHKSVGDCLAELALKLGESENYKSPFARGAQEAGHKFPDVGKDDDIVVIVATVHNKKDKQIE